MQHNERTKGDKPRYPADHAFVIQFQEQGAEGERRAGRIEHLTSGRGLRFHSSEQLMEFVADVLSAIDDPERDADGKLDPGN
jgi:hypothetical protein